MVVPVVTHVTLPAKTVATVGKVLLHVPLVGLPLSVIIAPIHSAVGPVIVGVGLTVTIVALVQLVGKV